jgi:Putative metallopeptidase
MVLLAMATESKLGRLRGELVEPKNPAHRPIYEELKNTRIVERLAEFLSPFRLPRDVVMKVEGCDGVANAFYGDGVISVCYEYLDYIRDNARQAQVAGEPTPPSAIVGATIDVFLHEMGHAVFDLLEIPLFGREEDAADQFSAYLLLHVGGEQARALIEGVAFLGRRETRAAMSGHQQLKHYADEHGLPAQRYFNLLCTAYGFDAAMFADAVGPSRLTAERAESCDDEYAQLDTAFRKLIWPHIDQARLSEVRARNLLRFDAPE